MQPTPPGSPDPMHSEEFLRSLMRRQLRLSIACATAFLMVLLALPVLNHLFPELMARRILGFTFTWFLLGVGIFPVVWIISFVFIRRSIALEDAEAKEILSGRPSTPREP